jgi:hypothetical protein
VSECYAAPRGRICRRIRRTSGASIDAAVNGVLIEKMITRFAFATAVSLRLALAPATERTMAEGNTLRPRKGDERRAVRVVRVSYPLVEGVEDAWEGPGAVVLNLTDFDEVEVFDAPRGIALTSVAAVLAFAAAAGAAIALALAAAPGD